MHLGFPVWVLATLLPVRHAQIAPQQRLWPSSCESRMVWALAHAGVWVRVYVPLNPKAYKPYTLQTLYYRLGDTPNSSSSIPRDALKQSSTVLEPGGFGCSVWLGFRAGCLGSRVGSARSHSMTTHKHAHRSALAGSEFGVTDLYVVDTAVLLQLQQRLVCR